MVKVTVKENTNLKEEINILKQTLELFAVRKKDFPLPGKIIIIEDILKTPIFFEIGKFLEIADFLNFQQMNKSIFFGTSLDTKFVSLVTKSLHRKFKHQVLKLEEQLSILLKF